jgi:pimeloyl-ACP methyl ester carboxylesterase
MLRSEISTTGRAIIRQETPAPVLQEAPPEQRKARRAPSEPLSARALRLLLSRLQSLSPALAARLLVRLWFTPPHAALSRSAKAALAGGAPLPLQIGGRRVAAVSFGAGPPVALMHGWGGHAGQLLDFVAPLVEAGFQAVLFDALGHGQSAPSPLGWRQASFFDFADSLFAVERAVGPLAGLVAHSGGAVASGIALSRGLHVERAVLLAPFARPALFAKEFGRSLGLDEALARRWQALAALRLGFRWEDLELTSVPERLAVPPLLVIHDEGDRETSIDEGRAVAAAWPRAELVTTKGLGHRRLLREPVVIRRAVEFLAAR